METERQLDQLRQQTRAAQHAASYPLLVLGILFLNYGIVGFGSDPVEWRYAGALAFVALWALGKANEYATGVGRGRGDYVAIACGVFVATQLTLSDWIMGASWFSDSRLQGMWVVIIGLGLVASGFSTRRLILVVWGAATCASGIALAIFQYPDWAYHEYSFTSFTRFRSGGQIVGLTNVGIPQTGRLVVILGIVLTLAGFVVFLRERRLS